MQIRVIPGDRHLPFSNSPYEFMIISGRPSALVSNNIGAGYPRLF